MITLQNIYLINLILISLCIGSFLNVVIYRLPQYKKDFNLNYPRSHCPICKTQLSWYENIPIIAWVLLKGQCKHCHVKISIRYPIYELVTGILISTPAILTSVSIISILEGLCVAMYIPIIVWSINKIRFNKQMYMWSTGVSSLTIITIASILCP